MILSFGAAAEGFASPSQRQEDRNKDGRAETTVFLNEGQIVREEVDHNADGQIDDITHFERGKRTRRTRDTNFDGQFERRYRYNRSGVLKEVASDTNRDGKLDRWDAYKKGRFLMLRQRDRNFDGKLDYRSLVEWVMHARENRYIYRSIWLEDDSDYDGTINKYRVRGVREPDPDRTGQPIEVRPEPVDEGEEAKASKPAVWDIQSVIEERAERMKLHEQSRENQAE